MNEHLEGRTLWGHWTIPLVYLAIAVCVTWPLAPRLTTDLPDGTDTLAHYWNGWWAWQAFRNGWSPYYTPYLFYPAGVSLVYKNLAWLHMLPWIALRPLIGGVAAYNLTFLTHLALCGYAAYLLAYDLTKDKRAAFLAGLIYQCWPYRLTQPSHPNLMSTEAIPIFLLFLVRTVRRGRWRDGLLAGLSLALVGYTRWQLLIPAVIVGGGYTLVALPGHLGRRPILALVLAAAVTGLALTPPALLFAYEWRTNPADLIVEHEEATMQADLLAYLTPPSRHLVLGAFTEPAYERYYAERGSRLEFSPYLGVTALLLAFIGIWVSPRRDSYPWIAIGLSLVLLALGPVLRVNGRLYPALPMPYGLVARLVLLRLLRAPERFNMSLAIPVAMLAAYGVRQLSSLTSRHKAWSSIVICLLGGAILFEYLVIPLPLQSARVSEFYAQLAAEGGDFAILNVPVDPYQSKPYMYAQTVHRRPIVQGRTSRYPKGTFKYLEGQAWLRAMRQYSEVPPKQTDISRQLTALASDNIRYLIVHKDLIAADRWAHWKRYLILTPRFEDEDIAVYATTPLAGRDFALASEIVPGVGIIRALVSSSCLRPGHVLGLDVAWGTTAPPGGDLDVEVALVAQEGTARQASVFAISQDWPARNWPASAVTWGTYSLQVPPTFPAGTYDVSLALVDPETGIGQGKAVVVDRVKVSPSLCTYAIPPEAVSVNALYDDAMRLLGYRLQQDEGKLALTLLWRSERRMATDYKVFVHVFDPTTGIPMAQDDAMPLHWTYPTSYWYPGEVVTDVISISLEQVQPGAYGIAVGIYDPGNMERLTVENEAGPLQPNDRLVLRGETVLVE